MKNFLSHAGVIAALLLALPLVAVGPCIAEAAQATAAKKKAEQPTPAAAAKVVEDEDDGESITY